MDTLTLVGLIVGFGAILIGQQLEGGHMDSLVNLPAFLIVFGGTIGAVMVQSPFPVFRRAIAMTPWMFIPPRIDFQQEIEKIVQWAGIARKEGLLGLENVSETETDELARKGLQLLVDGSEPNVIRTTLEVDMYNTESNDELACKVYEAMGGYSPTIGIIGAVIGLIHVMGNLSDPSKLGAGIATAFVATIYGVAAANLLFLPIANKLKMNVKRNMRKHEMLLEGLLGIAEGDNPRAIELKLQGFMDK